MMGYKYISQSSQSKFLLILVVALLITLYYENRDSSNSLVLSILSSYKFTEDPYSDRRPERRIPVTRDEFWIKDSDTVTLPFEVDYVPPDDSWGKVEPMWNCRTVDRSKKLVFVNIVRSEARAVQELLSSYASSCHAGFLSVGKLTMGIR